jgi:signal transduction histidine kinase
VVTQLDTADTEEAWWQVPRRPRDRRVVGGVAAGIADELGVDPLLIRVIFVVLTIAGGWGLLLYGAAWLWSWWAGGEGPVTSRPKGRSAAARHTALALLTVGGLLVVRSLDVGFVDSLVWPTAALAVGALAVWQRTRAEDAALDAGRWAGLRIIAGIAMAAGGVAALLALNFDLSAARNLVLGFAVLLGGLALIIGPWILRTVDELTQERRRRIRSEERTEVAAHLHESVLQTLALIQRSADDPQTMTRLARRQERELRDWLYGGGEPVESSLRRALLDLAAEVEELHGTPVEVVVVGDLTLATGDGTSALMGAVREAVVNASKHSGAPRVDVYAEVGADTVEIFVRDTGVGFDPALVGGDRRGLADSIRGRMERAGGRCTITSEAGHGTEVELVLPIGPEEAQP